MDLEEKVKNLARNPARLDIEYQQVNEAIRAIWPTYFNLASMTFAWNASMGTAYGVLMFYGTTEPSGTANLFGVRWYAVVALILCVVAIVYNWGAKKAYSLMNESISRLATEMLAIGEVGHFLLPGFLVGFMDKQEIKKRKLGAFTHFFFALLMAIWTVIFVLTIPILLPSFAEFFITHFGKAD